MIATLGEALVDLIEGSDGRFTAALGGSVFNVSLGLSRQGAPTTYLNPLSGDPFGQRFAGALAGAGVTSGAGRRSARPTSLAVVTLDEAGSPTYAFHREGVADRDAEAAELIAALPRALALLHSGGLALVPADLSRTTELIGEATRRGALVSLDANVRMAATLDHASYLAGVWSALGHAHVVKLSLEDLQLLGRGADPAEAAAELLAGGVTRLVALTYGGGGAELLSRSARVRLRAPEGLAIVDTVGAGDCFFSGLLAWLHRAGDLAPGGLDDLGARTLGPALRHAVASASLDLLAAGCAPPSWAEAESFARTLDVPT